MIFVQRLNTGKAEPLAGTETGIFPFWSPDGKYLGFFSNGKLRKIASGGGPIQVLCDAPEGRGGAHGTSKAPSCSRQIFPVRCSACPTPVAHPRIATPAHNDDKEFTNRNPYFLPDGKHFLFVQRSGKDSRGSVHSGSLDGGELKQVLPLGSNVAYSNGYLFYVKDGDINGAAV